MKRITFPNGMTVKDLKNLLLEYPEFDDVTGEECTVWMSTTNNLSSPVINAIPLNKRTSESVDNSADILFSTYEN